uniref:Uncharacterized protein n=1 Tax=Lepeophtheirus salmonis TaxID=72036 RepID=A0A0K2V4D1_LEPSM
MGNNFLELLFLFVKLFTLKITTSTYIQGCLYLWYMYVDILRGCIKSDYVVVLDSSYNYRV